jgi:hypothetical protein
MPPAQLQSRGCAQKRRRLGRLLPALLLLLVGMWRLCGPHRVLLLPLPLLLLRVVPLPVLTPMHQQQLLLLHRCCCPEEEHLGQLHCCHPSVPPLLLQQLLPLPECLPWCHLLLLLLPLGLEGLLQQLLSPWRYHRCHHWCA